MPHELVLRDHRALQQAVVRTTVAGAGAGLLHACVPGVLGGAFGMLAVGIAAVPPRSLRSLALAGTLAALVVGTAQLAAWPAAAAAALLGGLLYARDADGTGRRLAATIGGAVALAAGGFVALALGAAEALEGVPPALAGLTLGGAAGFLAGFGVLGREVERVPSLAPADAARALPAAEPPADGSGEFGELFARATAACHDVERSLGDEEPSAATAARELVRRVAGFAGRWRALETDAARLDRAALLARLDHMTARARDAVDEDARADYRRAERALRQQLDDLDGIAACRERAVARLHHHVAVLERLRLAALHRRSADAGATGVELAPLVDELAAASLDLDAAAQGLREAG
jgi:hypothetical protein